MTQDTVFFIIATASNFIASAWILGALFTDRLQALPQWHRIGLLVGVAGLLVQAMRNLWFLFTGESLADSELPLWYLKDLGYFIIAAHSIYLVMKGHLKLNTSSPVKKPPVKKAPAKRIKRT